MARDAAMGILSHYERPGPHAVPSLATPASAQSPTKATIDELIAQLSQRQHEISREAIRHAIEDIEGAKDTGTAESSTPSSKGADP